ncbi:hypothetical protein [Yoonia sediminilitoris]|nr:hypothetical protein [Yoonia sediminilitoris]
MHSFALSYPARSDFDWCWFLRRQGKSGEAIERILHDIGVMHPDGWADWRPSVLTSTGSPVEMLFSTAQPDLQLMTEVADPASDPNGRVDEVCRIMDGYGAKLPPASLRDVISAAQGAGPLKFGAWLGLRHGKGKTHCDIIAEVPAEADDLSTLFSAHDLSSVLEAFGPKVRPKTIVFDGTTGATSILFELADATRHCLPVLADAAQVSPLILSNAIDGLTGANPGGPLPFNRLGFRFTDHGNGQLKVLKLHFSATDALGSDDEIVRRITACGGNAFNGYGALIESLPHVPARFKHHGCVGLIARQNAAPVLCAGVAAPWTSLFEPY